MKKTPRPAMHCYFYLQWLVCGSSLTPIGQSSTPAVGKLLQNFLAYTLRFSG